MKLVGDCSVVGTTNEVRADAGLPILEVLPKGSPLANAMSIAILKIGENGTLRQLEKKWFSVSLSNYVDPDEERNQSLGLSNYNYIFIISSCLAFLTILHRYFDAIYHTCQEQTPEEPHIMGEPSQGTQRTASFSNLSIATRVLLSFLSDRPQRAQPIELRTLLDSGEHELGNWPNLGLHRAATFTNISRTTRVPQSFYSLRSQRTQEIEDQHGGVLRI